MAEFVYEEHWYSREGPLCTPFYHDVAFEKHMRKYVKKLIKKHMKKKHERNIAGKEEEGKRGKKLCATSSNLNANRYSQFYIISWLKGALFFWLGVENGSP